MKDRYEEEDLRKYKEYEEVKRGAGGKENNLGEEESFPSGYDSRYEKKRANFSAPRRVT